MIGFDQPPPFLRSYKKLPIPITREASAFRTDSDVAQLAAIRAGVGIGVCQYGIARRNSDIVSILPGLFRLELETFVVMHADQRKSRHVKLAFDEIHRGMADYSLTAAVPSM